MAVTKRGAVVQTGVGEAIMRRGAIVALLLLAGCGSEQVAENEQGGMPNQGVDLTECGTQVLAILAAEGVPWPAAASCSRLVEAADIQ